MELDHILHPSHKLTYQKSVKRNVEGVVCAACSDYISSEHYSCAECNFFIHKSCAQRPSELTHELHPLHPLCLVPESPYSDELILRCEFCCKTIKGSFYSCEICHFDLDFICAFPDGLKLNHACHPEHVLTHEKVVKKANKGVACAACSDEISTEHYSCGVCNFFLHKLCAQRPLELTHPLHPLHPLRLLRESPYGGVSYCNHCRMVLDGFVYYCQICEFVLDFLCAFPDGSKPYHVGHPHGLTLEKVVKKADKGVACAACLQEISGPLADYYSCRKCNIFLHEICFRQPVELTSTLHPQHPLRLLPGDPYKSGTAFCDGCHKPMKGFVYDCSLCKEFTIDFKCALTKPENRIQNLEELHRHPLIFQPRPAKFSCDLCSSTGGEGDKEDQAYLCSICDFYIHKSCALTTLAQRYKGHPHPLSLVQGVPKDLQIYDGLNCDVCHSTISPEDWVSHCPCCRYFVHVRCMTTNDTNPISFIKVGVDYLDDSFFKYLFMDDEFVLVQWPPSDISSELIQPFLIGKSGIVMDVQPKIRHFSHEQHDMILFEEQAVNNDNFFEEEDEEILCNACIQSISAPYYCCQECNYFLHLACANLPSTIKHFSHPHELCLTSTKRFYEAFKCDRCQFRTNGLMYWCQKCSFRLDLTCAALPAVIMHETHEHPLFEMTAKDEALCYACDYSEDNGTFIFKCRLCDDVYLHYECAMRSRHIRHRWDRHHPIVLRFPPHTDHPDHFMCDMCEKLIHPKRWLYSCFQCDVSFHMNCAPRYERYPNLKYGGKLQISSHHHILQHLRKATLKNTCDRCERKFDLDGVFECETCYDCFCYICLTSELLE